MKDKKYYTPSVEEFHIGFEYERASVDNNWRNTGWSNQIIHSNDSTFKDTLSYPELFRVKYLDKEDIESLGFKLSWNDYQHLYYTNRENTLILFTINNNKLEIFNSNIKEKFKSVLFRGNIKNKSELKVLLKQLKIL